MKKTRIFVAFLMIVAMMGFAGCSNDDGMSPTDNGTMDNNIVDDGVNDVKRDVNDMNNDVMDNGTMNTSGSGVNDNMNDNMNDGVAQ